MLLRDLLPAEARCDPRLAAREVTGVALDSRKVRPGNLFVAVPGTRADGLAFVPAALAAGATAVLAEREPPSLPEGVAFVQVPNVRRALAFAAARFYPRQPQTLVAVTGTAGKTSVAHFTRQIWQRLGHRAAYIGTLGVVSPTGGAYGSLTTPDPVELHRMIDELAGAEVTHLAVEASSHGLDQHRLDGLRLTAAAFTNLGRDHLDYHPTMAEYLSAKLRLFTELLPKEGTVVVPVAERPLPGVADVLAVARSRGLNTLTVLASSGPMPHVEATLRARVSLSSSGATVLHQRLDFDPPVAGRSSIPLPVLGNFQASNALVAAGLAIAGGAEPGAVIDALAHLEGVPGRLELAGRKRGAPVFVDYAHKPEALGEVIGTLRPLVGEGAGRLIVVFGCGGDRDAGKRPLMGAIAAERADLVVVTDDNPRSEDPAAIRRAILAAAPGATEIGDRGEAIAWAIGELRAGDVLLIAGKGHETGQIVGDRVLPFSDQEAARAALGETVA